MLWGLLGFSFSAALMYGKEEGARSLGNSTGWAPQPRKPQTSKCQRSPDPHLSPVLTSEGQPSTERPSRIIHSGGPFPFHQVLLNIQPSSRPLCWLLSSGPCSRASQCSVRSEWRCAGYPCKRMVEPAFPASGASATYPLPLPYVTISLLCPHLKMS